MTLLLLPLLATAGEPASNVVRGADAPTYEIAGGKGTARLLLGPATGASEAALDLLVLAPGAQVPLHTHDTSAELLYILEGEVEMSIAGQVVRAGKGDAVRIPAGVEHGARVLGGELRAVQVYVGPGPEQRFTTGRKVQ